MSHKNSKQIKAKNGNEQSLEMTQSHEGIIPSADELERLEQLNPGMIERFMKMAETDQKYYIENNKYFFDKVNFSVNLGKILGFIVFMTINALALYMIHMGFSENAVYVIITEFIGGLIAYFKRNKK